jgi:SAM-dependent methyltransferase
MLLAAGAAHVTALEPSDAFDVLARQTAAAVDRVTCVRGRGEDLPATGDRDYVLSIGVLHHIVDPQPALRAAYGALRPGGRMIAWLYGHEGNAAYLLALGVLRRVTRHATPALLALASEGLTVAVDAYTAACRVLPLPLRAYLVEVLARFPRDKRRLVVYDQLNPAYARYYREAEARALLEDAGFVDVRLYHRHGYSWTVMGTRPA